MCQKNDNTVNKNKDKSSIFVPYKWVTFSALTTPIWFSSSYIKHITIEYRTKDKASVPGDTGDAARKKQEVWRLGFETFEDFFEG
jgi:hypothetical protein